MSSHDFIPHKTVHFHLWQENLIEILEPKAASWGIPTAEINVLKEQRIRWNSVFEKWNNRNNRTSADVVEKIEFLKGYDKNLRIFINQWLSHNMMIPDGEKERMGLTVRTGSRTPVADPTTRPVASIDFSQRMQHTISYYDEGSSGRAKPEGVLGCEIWVKAGDTAPKGASELTYVGTSLHSPFLNTFGGENSGKTAFYWLRWVSRRGRPGPWSSPVSAMIVG